MALSVLVCVDVSDVREGKLDELRVATRRLAAFVEREEARPLLYRVHFDEAGSRMTVVQVHPDPASMEAHMDLAASAFPGFRELLRLREVDFYGDPGPKLLERLQRKAELLGGARVRVHPLHAGFARFGDLQRGEISL